jgi:hypothetical protein
MKAAISSISRGAPAALGDTLGSMLISLPLIEYDAFPDQGIQHPVENGHGARLRQDVPFQELPIEAHRKSTFVSVPHQALEPPIRRMQGMAVPHHPAVRAGVLKEVLQLLLPPNADMPSRLPVIIL